ncbi:MAG: caspase family protein, partial [Paracoccaceae bacterium]|nr:caspase family protein [Paracoccaceae bacterium]
QLLAVDIDKLTADQIEAKRVQMSDVLAKTSPGSGGRSETLRLVIIDACRNDPFSSVDASFQRGITFEESGDAQTLIAYSTSAGQLAFDGPIGGNGPYALALIQALKKRNATVFSALQSVRRGVRIATDGLQIPWVVGSTETDPPMGAVQSDVALPDVSDDVPQLDEIVWYFMSSDLTAETLAQFVSNFSNSRHVQEASKRMREIQALQSDATRQLVLVDQDVSSGTLQSLADARAQIEMDSVFEPRTDIPAELFALWPETMPDVAGGLGKVVTRCDRLASDPADPQHVAPPLREGLINVREAARACGFALNNDPDNPRLLFQFGRILQVAGRYEWARAFYTRASAQGYSAALVNLGYMAIQGIGQEVDYDAAGQYYRKAAALGNLRARTNIGSMYIRGTGVPVTPEEGVLWYRLASDMGWANAQNALADLYRKGIGVPQDYQASIALYNLAAANGQRDAMTSIGRSYLAGWGVEPDRDTAHTWLERAISAGDRFAPLFFAEDLIDSGDGSKDPSRVRDLLQLAADRGFLKAYAELTELYLNGKVLPLDGEKAYENALLAKSAKLEGADELVARARATIDAVTAGQIEAELALRQRLNGL